MAFYIFEGQAYIKWLYTDSEMRDMGAATALMDTVMSLIKDMNLNGISTDFDMSDDSVEDFLTDYGFLVGNDNNVYSVPVSDIVCRR